MARTQVFTLVSIYSSHVKRYLATLSFLQHLPVTRVSIYFGVKKSEIVLKVKQKGPAGISFASLGDEWRPYGSPSCSKGTDVAQECHTNKGGTGIWPCSQLAHS